MNQYYVYILSSGRDGTLYVGITNDLIRRVAEHKNGEVAGFTQKYKVDRLVYFDETPDVNAAITREKQIKRWKRAWKIRMIEERNPQWRDLYDDFIEG